MAFHYVLLSKTVRPVDLLDERGLIALVESVPVLSCPRDSSASAEPCRPISSEVAGQADFQPG